MNSNYSVKDRINYRFENLISKGPFALIGTLLAVSMIVISIFSIFVFLTNSSPHSENFLIIIWQTLMRTIDPGVITTDQGHILFMSSMFMITIFGIFLISSIIGIVTTSLDSKIDSIRRGKSKIIEQEHTVILGWSEQIYTILSELNIANESNRNNLIAILSELDKLDMEEDIRGKINIPRNTKIICRTGNRMDLSDLDIMSLNTSKSIIILSSEVSDPDCEVIKTVLAIVNNPHRRETPYNISAMIRNPENLEIAKIAGRQEVNLILEGDFIARIIAQTCLQPGLSIVINEIIDFMGDEIYFHFDPGLTGKTYQQLLFAYDNSSVIGLIDQKGKVMLNPSADTVLDAGGQIILIARDHNSIHLSNENYICENKSIVKSYKDNAEPQKILILGWNWKVPIIIDELDEYLSPASYVKIVANLADQENFNKLNNHSYKNFKLDFQTGITTNRKLLDALCLEDYHHIIILCNADFENPQQADSNTLMTLLHVRDIAMKKNLNFSIVSEIKDIKNKNLAEITRADDFIVSDKMTSLLLAQLSENKHLLKIYQELFDSLGSEIYLKPAQSYVKLCEPVNFATVIQSAIDKNETAIGYRKYQANSNSNNFFGIFINPSKSETIEFQEQDKIIVISEDFL